jgi:hypothetical protein
MASHMKVLIQEKTSGRFFGAEGRWTESREDAHDFGYSVDAIALAHRLRLKNVGVLVAFSDGSPDVSIAAGSVIPTYAEMTGSD